MAVVLQSHSPMVHVFFAHPAIHAVVFPQHHRVQTIQEDRLIDKQIILLYFSASLLLLLEDLLLLAKTSGLKIIRGAIRGILVVLILIIIIV